MPTNMTLDERIRALAKDVAQGDTTGSLKQELQQYQQDTDQTIAEIQANLETLNSQVQQLQEQTNIDVQNKLYSSQPGNV